MSRKLVTPLVNLIFFVRFRWCFTCWFDLMAYRGRGRGYGALRPAKQVSFELFPEVENLGTAASVTERISLAIWQANLQKYWNSSPYYLAEESDVLKRTKGMDIERFSDRSSERTKSKPPLTHFIRMDSAHVPTELAKDMKKLDLLEKLDQKSKGDDEKKKDGEEEDEEQEEKIEEEEEFSDDGDYNQNLYDYDDDEDDYNMNEDNNDDAMY